MSRAFTKEDDAGDEVIERPVPEGPNYVTPRGLDLLKNEVAALLERKKALAASGGELLTVNRDLRYLEARINGAIVVPPGSGDEARFGARITIEDHAGQRRTFRIVGDDEARADPGSLLSWSAPLAFAVLGARAGDAVTWDSPDGAVTYRLIDVSWPPAE